MCSQDHRVQFVFESASLRSQLGIVSHKCKVTLPVSLLREASLIPQIVDYANVSLTTISFANPSYRSVLWIPPDRASHLCYWSLARDVLVMPVRSTQTVEKNHRGKSSVLNCVCAPPLHIPASQSLNSLSKDLTRSSSQIVMTNKHFLILVRLENT